MKDLIRSIGALFRWSFRSCGKPSLKRAAESRRLERLKAELLYDGLVELNRSGYPLDLLRFLHRVVEYLSLE